MCGPEDFRFLEIFEPRGGAMITIKKGLDLPIQGKPSDEISEFTATKRVALTGLDYVGLKPQIMAKVGQTVKEGEPLFASKENEGVVYTAPRPGKVVEINRGPRRVLESFVIEVDESAGVKEFDAISDEGLMSASPDDVKKVLVESGLFAAFRQRPYSRIPQLSERPHSIFVTIRY